jgi:hypothetical protein
MGLCEAPSSKGLSEAPFTITYSAWVTSKNGQSIHEAQLLY